MPASTSIHPDLISCSSEERSEPPGRAQRSETAERREVLPGLPGGPGVDEQPLEISDEVLDALLAGASTAQEIAGPDGLLGHLTRRLLNRALEAELSEHLGYEPDQAPPVHQGRRGRVAEERRTLAVVGMHELAVGLGGQQQHVGRLPGLDQPLGQAQTVDEAGAAEVEIQCPAPSSAGRGDPGERRRWWAGSNRETACKGGESRSLPADTRRWRTAFGPRRRPGRRRIPRDAARCRCTIPVLSAIFPGVHSGNGLANSWLVSVLPGGDTRWRGWRRTLAPFA